MSSYDNMSGSEDGQLRSPNDDHYISGDDDTDSLDIKPPQARLSYTSREATSSGRRKEKKHSKERKHKERRLSAGGAGGGSGAISRSEREQRSSRGESGSEREHRRNELLEPRRDYRRDERHELERYHQRNERPEQIDRRYAKHSGGHHPYHYHHQPPPPPAPYGHHHQHHHQPPPPPPLHMPARALPRHEYYHADYHHNNRHVGSGQLYDGGGGDLEMGRDVRRYKYGYEQTKDAESLEQDLRSRLLSKRHKYVKDYEIDEHHYERGRDVERKERRSGDDYERERAAAKAERHKLRREKERGNVIEVLDSPDVLTARTETRRKHKMHSNNRERPVEYMDEEPPRRKTPDDPELLARRAKLLAAEREKEKRKEYAREELEARRELLRERIEHSDALSPSAVAASVTAGLNVVVKRKSSTDKVTVVKRRKHAKKSKVTDEHSDVDGNGDESEESESDSSQSDDDDDEENENGEDSSGETGSDSAAQSVESYEDRKQKRTKRKSKRNELHKNGAGNDDDDDEEDDVPLPDSPLSIGELYKSPTTRKHKSKRSHSGSTASSRASSRRSSQSSRSRSNTRSDSARSNSRSSSERSHTHSEHSSHRRTRSHSASSGTRSEERGMTATHLVDKSNDDVTTPLPAEEEKLIVQDGLNKEQVPCDEKGVPLPNYFPGVQGCRSVEEFQCLNRIEEGTYGVVYRAKDKRTNEIVALKRLKMEKEKEGFPITSLREINTLLKGQHPNIVTVREIVVGSNMDKIFIVMDYVEHDLKSLMETMKTRKQSFFPGEVKCLTQQLLLAVAHLHDNWILHRDLKTSNLLLSHKGILKVGDFGLAREYGSPLKKYTSLVVTLWYRAPELLLCSPEYSTPIDIWSVGCIFAEFLQMSPLVPGKSEVDQLNRIFKELGTPNEKIWPGYNELPAVKNMLSQNSQFTEYPVSQLRKHFIDKTTEMGISLLQSLLTYDPKQRLTADGALKHAYFKELPLPIDPSMFPTWPAKSELGARKANSPKPPSGGSQFKQLGGGDEAAMAGGSAAAGGSGVTAGTAAAAGGAKLTSGIITGHKKSAAASNTGFVLNSGLTQRQLAMGPGFSLKF